MKRLSASSLAALLLVALAMACHALPELEVAPSDSTVCYSRRFGPWTSERLSIFGTAPVGFQAPLPDTIALSHTVARTSYGRPLYTVLTTGTDSSHTRGFWVAWGQDSVMVRFGSRYGWGLQLVLPGIAEGGRGRAGVFSEESTDQVSINPSATVTAVRVSCPETLTSLRPGA